MQDTLAIATERLDSFRGDGSIEGWLVRIVASACRRMSRGRKNDPALHVSDHEITTDDAGPERAAVRSELTEVLDHALHELTPMDRAIVLLADLDDWSGPEIARELGLSPGAVRTRLSRARHRLRESLKIDP